MAIDIFGHVRTLIRKVNEIKSRLTMLLILLRNPLQFAERITAISRMTIKELICCYGNGYIKELPLNSFLTEGPNNPKVPCTCRSVRDLLNL